MMRRHGNRALNRRCLCRLQCEYHHLLIIPYVVSFALSSGWAYSLKTVPQLRKALALPTLLVASWHGVARAVQTGAPRHRGTAYGIVGTLAAGYFLYLVSLVVGAEAGTRFNWPLLLGLAAALVVAAATCFRVWRTVFPIFESSVPQKKNGQIVLGPPD